MKKAKGILIVCRSLNEIKLLSRLRAKAEHRYILASDDIRVHGVGRRYPWVDEVCWIEKMESFRSVAGNVISFLGVINQWLRSLSDNKHGVPAELLFWICHVEGGSAQHIQDALLLIRSYLHLIEMYNIGGIILFRSPGMEWADNVLIQTAKSKGIGVTFLGRFGYSVLLERIRYTVKTIARQPYYILSLIKTRIRESTKRGGHEKYEKEIAFQLCGSDDRHIENIVPIMKALAKKGYDPVALCWRAAAGADMVQHQGLRAVTLENFVSIASIWSSLYRVFRTFKKAWKRRREFFLIPELCYNNVLLGGLLWPSILFFLTAELPQRYILDLGMKKYFEAHSPLAIKLWGGDTLIEGHLALRNINMKKKPLLMYWFWIVMDYPYESKYEQIDLILTSGRYHEKHLKKLGVSPDRIASVGMSRYDHLKNFTREFAPDQSRSYLKIPSFYSMYILYDVNLVLRGFQTLQEQMRVMDTLLLVVRNNPSVGLIIKPHPCYQYELIQGLIDDASLKNVFVVDKNMLPYHAINSADLLITKYSNIALEAMLVGRPVLCVICDQDERFKLYGNAVEYVNSENELSAFLSRLVEDRTFRSGWAENQIRDQKRFLKEFFCEMREASSDLAGDTIDEFIKKHNR